MAKMKLILRYTAKDLNDDDHEEATRLRPNKLTTEEALVWDRIAPLLAAHDYLNDMFVDSLVEYCRVICEIDEAINYLREEGRTYSSHTRNGIQIKARPEVGHVHELRRMLRSYVSDFGLTPQARKQLEAVQADLFDDDSEQENPFIQDEKTYSSSQGSRQH